MGARLVRLLKRIAWVIGIAFVALLGIRAYDSQRGPPLQLWHTHVPHELSSAEIRKADWSAYLAAEQAVFEDVRTHVTDQLDEDAKNPANRYFDGSPLYPGHFQHDWNRSFILEPDTAAVGAIVFLHGLTDSPYSARGVARLYREYGYVCIAIRLPGHGTAKEPVRWLNI